LLAHNLAQDRNGTFDSVTVSAHVSTPVACILEELDVVRQLSFSLLALFWADFVSHVGYNDKVPQRVVAAELRKFFTAMQLTRKSEMRCM
jgi:hypothetical protein